jgi:HEAT repeat protein
MSDASLDAEVVRALEATREEDFFERSWHIGSRTWMGVHTPGEQAEARLRTLYIRRRLRDPDQRVRECMLYALGGTHDPSLASVAVEMTREESPRLRALAYEALGGTLQFPDVHGGQALRFLATFEAGLADPDPLVQVHTLKSMRRIEPLRQVIELLLPFVSHENPALRKQAAWSLCSRGTPALVEDIVSALSRATEDPEEPVRVSASIALTSYKHPSSIPTLLRLLEPTSGKMPGSSRLWQDCLSVLGLIGDVSVVPEMLRTLEWHGPEAMKHLLWGLSHFESTALMPKLLEAIEHPQASVREAAALVLGAKGGAKEVTALGRKLGDARGEVRASAARALANIGKRLAKQRDRVIELLKPLSDDTRVLLAELAPPAAAPLEEVTELEPTTGTRQEPETVMRSLAELRFFEGLPAVSPTAIQKELQGGKFGAVFQECGYGMRHLRLDHFDLCSKGRAGSVLETLKPYLERKGVPALSIAHLPGGKGDEQLMVNGSSVMLSTARERKTLDHYKLLPLRFMNAIDGLLRAAGSAERVFFSPQEGSPDLDMYMLTLPMARVLAGSGYWPTKLVLAAAALQQGGAPQRKSRARSAKK